MAETTKIIQQVIQVLSDEPYPTTAKIIQQVIQVLSLPGSAPSPSGFNTYIGDLEVNRIYLGNTEVIAAYLGSHQL